MTENTEKNDVKKMLQERKPSYIVWDKGKPVTASDEKEARRLEGRTAIIDSVLKEMGYAEGYGKYNEYVAQMVKTDFPAYMKFLKRVDELAGKKGV